MPRFILLLWLSTMFGSGCTHQAYPGNSRPDSEISNIYIARNAEVTTEDLSIDGLKVSGFASSYDVLPGRHEIKFNYRTEQEDCSGHYCYTDVEYGICRGDLKVLAGRQYLVTIEFKPPILSVRVSAKGYFDFSNRDEEGYIGGFQCQEFKY